jgi:hypothetical protein
MDLDPKVLVYRHLIHSLGFSADHLCRLPSELNQAKCVLRVQKSSVLLLVLLDLQSNRYRIIIALNES